MFRLITIDSGIWYFLHRIHWSSMQYICTGNSSTQTLHFGRKHPTSHPPQDVLNWLGLVYMPATHRQPTRLLQAQSLTFTCVFGAVCRRSFTQSQSETVFLLPEGSLCSHLKRKVFLTFT